MTTPNDRWFAARQTRLVYMPRHSLETFGETSVQYRLLSEISEGQLRLRSGIVKAARPRIITPQYMISTALENFGEDARRYFQDFMSRGEDMLILQYGLMFQKQEYGEETFGGNILETAEQLAKEAQDDSRETRGVLIGDDDMWEISLVYFLRTLIARSAPGNIRDLNSRGLLSSRNGIPVAVHNEIQQDFSNAVTRQHAEELGNKLRDYGIFSEYEEQFFQLFSKLRNK